MKNAVKTTQPVLSQRKLISPLQRDAGLALIILGLLIMLVDLFGYLAGDWQLGPFADLTDQVFIAREVATSAGTRVMVAFDMDGKENSILSGTESKDFNRIFLQIVHSCVILGFQKNLVVISEIS